MRKIKFYIIYSVDWGDYDYNGHPNHEKYFKPPDCEELWELTEEDESEFSEIFTEHRKWVTKEPITKEQFEKFIQDQGLVPEDTETLGSLTIHGWLPAISFSGDSPSEYQNAYVTPIMEGRILTEEYWDRLRNATISWAKEVV